MGSAALPGGVGEHRGDRRFDPAVRVGDDEFDASEAPGDQRAEELGPAGGVFGGDDVEPGDLPAPSALATVAITAVTLTTRPPSRTFSVRPSIHRYL